MGVFLKAFLSHSSKDKGFVNQVAQIVGGANAHLDSETFEFGLLNSQAIIKALEDSELFVLFVSAQSIDSKIVKFESQIAEDLLSKGLIDRMLFICLDAKAFSEADARWKAYNFVRREASAKSIARLIQSTLMGIRARKGVAEQPFVGRGDELEKAKDRLIDPEKKPPSAIYVSGNTGIGRRTFARKLYKDIFPAVNSIIPELAVDSYDSYDEIYRKIRAQVESDQAVLDRGGRLVVADEIANLLHIRSPNSKASVTRPNRGDARTSIESFRGDRLTKLKCAPASVGGLDLGADVVPHPRGDVGEALQRRDHGDHDQCGD